MLTAPLEVAPKAPDDNSHYWKSFIGMLKEREGFHIRYGGLIHEVRPELDEVQIALELGLPLKLVDEFIWFLDWVEFIQPGKRKEADRKAWSARQKLLASPEQLKALEITTKRMKMVLRDFNMLNGWEDHATVEDYMRHQFIHCLRNWRPEGGASFNTFFYRMAELKMAQVKMVIARRYEINNAINRISGVLAEAA
jgi:hypothetical protein